MTEKIMSQEATSEKPGRKKPDGPQFGQPLTRKEREVLLLRAEGLTQRGVAERLFITPRTVNFHSANAYVKLGVHTLLSAMRVMERPLHDKDFTEHKDLAETSRNERR